MNARFHIVDAEAEPHIAAVRDLFVEYQRWLGVDLCFQGFAGELTSLPGEYARPRGRLLLAEADDGEAAGCVALRALDQERCEMKRLYVRPQYQGSGLGRTLIARLLEEARALGYRDMLLDTLPQMQAAQHLYVAFGFQDTGPYRPDPLPGARNLICSLRGAPR